jgi:hypothetical protein
MEDCQCPNYEGCQLLNSDSVTANNNLKNKYRIDYCTNTNWKNCKRYISKSTLNFCPDFVFPDTPLNPSEIMNKYDEQLNY